jgi:glycerol transport system ATP-binding protein
MAKITIDNLKHAYIPEPTRDEHYALKHVDLQWADGGAYALLGPSGCGKTTLLNLISGLLHPSHGRILFDDKDVTLTTPEQRNIAQVFQFPVIYDTMTVYDNLAFPLRNRGVDEAEIKKRVTEIGEMLELAATLHTKASGLTADGKQKISLGRGLVRSDVNVIMFDEPLTVIDPHLKWQLRSKLKELQQRIKRTMIYVTHDQTEALTFADQVVVMNNGEVVQTGTPFELFERPMHTFVGHFIGSPGMNLLPCDVKGGKAFVGGHEIAVANGQSVAGGKLELGVRPEFVSFTKTGIPAEVVRVSDVGRYRVVDTRVAGSSVKLIVEEGMPIPEGKAQLAFDAAHTQIYSDGWLAGGARSGAT